MESARNVSVTLHAKLSEKRQSEAFSIPPDDHPTLFRGAFYIHYLVISVTAVTAGSRGLQPPAPPHLGTFGAFGTFGGFRRPARRSAAPPCNNAKLCRYLGDSCAGFCASSALVLRQLVRQLVPLGTLRPTRQNLHTTAILPYCEATASGWLTHRP